MLNQVSTLTENVSAFVNIDETMRTLFFRGEPILVHLSSCILTQFHFTALETLAKVRDAIQQTSLCSDEATEELLPFLVAVCATTQNSMETISRLVSAFTALSRVFIPSARLLIPATVLAREAIPVDAFADYAIRTMDIFEHIHQDHPLLTGYEDLGAFALLACQPEACDTRIARIHSSKEQLRIPFFYGNTAQTVSHALAFSENVPKTIQQMQNIYNEGKSDDLSLQKGKIPAMISVLAYADNVQATEWVQRIEWVDGRLRKNNGFSPLLLSTKERLLFSCFLTALDEMDRLSSCAPMRLALDASILSLVGMQSADSATALPH